jgi:hypothetical protein
MQNLLLRTLHFEERLVPRSGSFQRRMTMIIQMKLSAATIQDAM